MIYDPNYARRQGGNSLHVLIGAMLYHFLGWWSIVGWIAMSLALAMYHEMRYGK